MIDRWKVTSTQPEASSPLATIEVADLTKNYVMGDNVVHALRGITLSVAPGDFVAVMGTSGSGKSTFMNVIGCLDLPTSGSYFLDGLDVAGLGPDDLAAVRSEKIGFIFQGFNLLPRMTALGNVALPMVYSGIPTSLREARARQALQAVGLTGRENHRPSELSGGQQQRVAIARSLVNSPSIILADEPTGNLDSQTSVEVMAILQQLNADGITIVLVTHESDIADYCQRVVRFRDGRVVEDRRNLNPVDAATVLASLPLNTEGGAA
jgi:putative ABC transport system ATP-binding protein